MTVKLHQGYLRFPITDIDTIIYFRLSSREVIPPFMGLFETRTTRPFGTGSVSWRV